jgi:hypothetical protein
MKLKFLFPCSFRKNKNKPPHFSEALSDGIKDAFNDFGYRKFVRINPMNMRSYHLNNHEQIDMIATCFADNFVKEVYDFQNEKSYSAYVKSLSEIFNWAHEFYIEYNHKMKDWESFEKSQDNIYNVNTMEDFQIAWGNQRIKQFFDQHAINTEHKSGKILNMEPNAANEVKNRELVYGN